MVRIVLINDAKLKKLYVHSFIRWKKIEEKKCFKSEIMTFMIVHEGFIFHVSYFLAPNMIIIDSIYNKRMNSLKRIISLLSLSKLPPKPQV